MALTDGRGISYSFSVTLLVCCTEELSVHNARVGLVKTLKYEILLGSLPSEPPSGG